MGCFGSKPIPPNPNEVDLTHFELLKVVGKGGFGKVNAITKLDTGELMALKRMEKYAVLQSSSHLKMVWIERKIMSLTASPFLCNLLYAFESERELFLVMPFMQGGDLRFHLKERGTMPVSTACFYAAEMILGLQAMHEKRVVFRDLKPDNMLLDADGHLRISDFGLACILEERNHWLTTGQAGTRGYQSPEVITDQLYGCEADIFSFGVTVYELLHGVRPWKDWTRLQQQAGQAVQQQQQQQANGGADKGAAAAAAANGAGADGALAAGSPNPAGSPPPGAGIGGLGVNGAGGEEKTSGDASGSGAAVRNMRSIHISSKLDAVTADFLTRILAVDKKKRLGCGGGLPGPPLGPANPPHLTGWEEVKAHPWFRDMDWEKLARKELAPPITPDLTRANCTADADLADQLLDRKPRDIPVEQQAHFRGWKFRTEISRPDPAGHNSAAAAAAASASGVAGGSGVTRGAGGANGAGGGGGSGPGHHPHQASANGVIVQEKQTPSQERKHHS